VPKTPLKSSHLSGRQSQNHAQPRLQGFLNPTRITILKHNLRYNLASEDLRLALEPTTQD